MDEHRSMVTVYRSRDVAKITVAKTLLDAHAIPFNVLNDISVEVSDIEQLGTSLERAPHGSEVQVDEEYVAQARGILSDLDGPVGMEP
jgi:hypothetical protein